jgi:SAM-dependent methyltransferase
MLALSGATLFFFGVSLWTVIIVLLLVACPASMAAAIYINQRPLPIPLGTAPATRGMTLNWLAPWYDSVWCPAFGLGRRYRDHVVALAGFRPGERVLDAGCGTGWLTRCAAEITGPSGAAWGIDAAPDMIRVALGEAARTRNSARFKLAAIEALPFEDASFDVVIASLVIHHLPSDVKATALREIHRVLKPNGRLLVAEPDRAEHWWWRTLLWPISLHRNMRDHLQGRIGNMLRNAGFASITPAGRWKHWLAFWQAQKPP